jgi:hypothetical protein
LNQSEKSDLFAKSFSNDSLIIRAANISLVFQDVS